MVNGLYYDVFEEFKRMCPWAAGKVKKWYSTEDMVIVIELNDGSAIQYDYILKTFRSAPSLNELKEKCAPNTEEKWRREFAIRLYKKIRIKGISLDELSWVSGVSVGSISNYVNGVSTPTVYNVRKLADALGCKVGELVDF